LTLTQGQAEVESTSLEEGAIAVVDSGSDFTVTTQTESHILLIGVEPLDGPSLIWWNFVSSSRDRLVSAREVSRLGARIVCGLASNPRSGDRG
jgi:redox-sensitive bicupin YhaK (pirin superfamily)